MRPGLLAMRRRHERVQVLDSPSHLFQYYLLALFVLSNLENKSAFTFLATLVHHTIAFSIAHFVIQCPLCYLYWC